MTNQQARNIVAMCQKEPFFYRNFGVWWWHVKRELKRNGFDRDQLQSLGSFTDPSCERYYDGMTTTELDNMAYEQQFEHVFSERNNPISGAPDGESYLLLDQDAE